MTIIKYLDSVDVLRRFNQVSKNCQHAIDETKINPCCGISGIGLAITLGLGRMIRIEQKAFPHLDTFQVHFRELEKLPIDSLKDYKLFEVYKYCMKDAPEQYKNLTAIRDRISVIGIDTTYNTELKLETMKNLRDLTLRINENPRRNILDDAFAAIAHNRSLRKCVIKFRSAQLDEIIEKCLPHQSRIRFVFVITWLDDAHADKVIDFISRVEGPVGISDINLDKFHDWFLRKEKVVLMPHINKYFRASKVMVKDPRYRELKNWYLPIKEETIQ